MNDLIELAAKSFRFGSDRMSVLDALGPQSIKKIGTKFPEQAAEDLIDRCQELLKYFYLASTSSSPLFFPGDKLMDDIWHTLIIETENYRALCKRIGSGGFIDHSGILFSEHVSQQGNQEVQYEQMSWLALYVAHFGPITQRTADILPLVEALKARYNVDLNSLNELASIVSQGSGVGSQSKFDLKDFIEQQIFPNADLLESRPSLVKLIMGNLVNGLRTTHPGSPIHTLISNSDLELMFGASATFAFTFWQYLAALERLSNCQDWQAENSSLWQKLSTGELLCGLATTHLAKPDGSSLVGTAQDNGFVINGVAPWVTGFGIYDYLVVGLSTETEIAFAVVDFPKEESQTSLLPLTSFAGTSTVRIEFKNKPISSNQICSRRLKGTTPPQPRPSKYLSPEIGIAERALKEARNHIDKKAHPKHEGIKQAISRLEEKIYEFKTARNKEKAPENLPVICDLINRDAVRLLGLTLGGSSILGNALVSRLYSETLLTDIVLQAATTIRSKIDEIGARAYEYN
ncbi:MAG: hypothetical protein ACJ763_03960 [Bdellovibrionia bacterium]